LSDTKLLTKEQIESISKDTSALLRLASCRLASCRSEVNMKKTDKERLDEALMLMDKMKETLSAAWRFINRVYEDGEELADKVNDVIETYEYTTTKWNDEDEEDEENKK
jgi:hypothetical protein